jgi:AraC family transcriptional regulator, ethanolamine operon transcriptional activator
MSSVPQQAEVREAWISRARYDDIDAQAAHFKGYGQQYQQLSRGPFQGRFNTFEFGADLAIHFERANRALAQSASTPAGRFGACVLDSASPECALNATTVTPEDVVLCPGRRSLEGKTPEGMSIFCLDLAMHLLPDGGAEMHSAGVLRDPAQSQRLRDILHSGVADFTALGSPAQYHAAARGFAAALADLLWQIAVRPIPDDLHAIRHNGSRKLQVFRRARDYIHHELPDGISITDVCRVAGVSRRSLEGVFRSVIGVGPAHYVRVLQLNRIRRDLMSPQAAGLSIGVIAARHGIWHWSRLAVYYRGLFGELPSQTRTRHRGSH